ncbi:alpha/beta hydrolase [Marivita sp.]|uniref:alpha/beta fold hydrolase n=1 Tax=Marivita sp. TaxID=2003365 RepID=UPI00262A7E75|nr:alpha/beta hydrolase [Marivita sp.]
MDIADIPPKPVELPTGATLNYIRDGAGDPLVFIHGAMGDYRSWRPQWTHFTTRFDCISYSRRYSFPNPNELTTHDHNALVDAADLEALLDALSLNSAILVGSSYGGFTALAMAARAPERVKAVVSVEAPMMRYAALTEEGTLISEAFLESAARPARAAFIRGDDVEGVRLLTGGISGRAPEAIPAALLDRRMTNVRAARSLALSDDEFPWIEPERLAALQMPILLMSGAETAPVHAAIFRNLCTAMPQAKVRIIPRSGHSVSQEQAEQFNSEVMAFLAENRLLARAPA